MIAYYLFHKQKMLPSEYLKLDRLEKGLIIAFIQEKMENDKQQQKELERKSKGKKK